MIIDFICKTLNDLLPGCPEVQRYREIYEKMTEAQFKQAMLDLRDGRTHITITAPNFSEPALSLENNMKVAKKLNIVFWNKLIVEGESGLRTYKTPKKYLVVLMPFRVASQRIAKKQSIPRSQKSINTLTGQPTGDSKGASISYPEIRVCTAMGLTNTLVELMKYRGGDQRGGAALNASLMRTGSADQNTLKYFASGVKSTKVFRTLLASAMLSTNL